MPKAEASSVEEESNLSESSSPSEDTGHISRKKENTFLATLVKIRKGDKDGWNEDLSIFSSSEKDDAKSDEDDDQSDVPLYLRDVQAGRLMKDGAEAFSTSEEEEEEEEEESGDEHDVYRSKRARVLGYDEQQRNLRAQFLEAADGSDDGSSEDGFGGLQKVDNKKEASDDEDVAKTQELLDEVFGNGKNRLTEDDNFLKNFIANQQWVESESEDSGIPDDGPDPNEDEEFLEKADSFEATYNFRFEEPGSSKIVSYPRFVESSIRKKEGKRKRQREKKQQRVAEKQRQNLQTIKTKKNLKKKEIQNKLAGLPEAAGGGAPAEDLLHDLLLGDFDMGEWDEKMLSAYGDDYYAHEDDEWKTEMDENNAQPKTDLVPQEQTQEETHDQGQQREMASLVRADVQNLIQEYYELNEEDNIDGMKCRFKYVQVPKDGYGLTPAELLCLEDKELNSFVGAKRLDPYRDDASTYKVNPYKLREIKRKVDFSKAKKPAKSQGSHKRFQPQSKEGGTVKNGSSTLMAKPDSKGIEDTSERGGTQKSDRLASYSRETLQPKNKRINQGALVGKKKVLNLKISKPKQQDEMLQKSQKKNRARKRSRKKNTKVDRAT